MVLGINHTAVGTGDTLLPVTAKVVRKFIEGDISLFREI